MPEVVKIMELVGIFNEVKDFVHYFVEGGLILYFLIIKNLY